MKCRIMWHFIWVYTVCIGKKIFRQNNIIFFENNDLTPLDIYTMDYLKFIVSNQKEESISIQRVIQRESLFVLFSVQEDTLFKMAMKTPSMLSLRSKIREDHLTCTICFNNFTHPKALPCLHTFCEGCIRDFVMGRGFDVQGQFPCPVCRLEIPIPSGGISAFPVGYIMWSTNQGSNLRF